MDNVLIFGAGGLGRMVLDILRQGQRYRPAAVLDSDPAKHGLVVDDVEVAGDLRQVEQLMRRGIRGALVAIGDNPTRIRLAGELQRRGLHLISAIHPLASISPTASLDKHVIIGARVCICVHARIGPHAVLSPGSIIEHDNVIGPGVFLYPAVRLAGTVFVDELATLGIGACVIPGRRIGRAAQVEPGAVVIRDVPPGARVGGVPAVPCVPPGRFAPGPSPELVEQAV
jgi:UDP-perosamine 4-acetyltransferase